MLVGGVGLVLLHLELFAAPGHGGDGAVVPAQLDLRHHGAVHVHHDQAAGGGAEVDLLVVRRPQPARDGRLEAQHGRPVALSRHRTYQHETVLRTKSHIY